MLEERKKKFGNNDISLDDEIKKGKERTYQNRNHHKHHNHNRNDRFDNRRSKPNNHQSRDKYESHHKKFKR